MGLSSQGRALAWRRGRCGGTGPRCSGRLPARGDATPSYPLIPADFGSVLNFLEAGHDRRHPAGFPRPDRVCPRSPAGVMVVYAHMG